ncbi:MAG TPA: TldD/PmbA family protein [Spirochaetota bacterium]|nr:TldD/PmbA family protein [Spirochaetota bacterium]
MNEKLSAAVEKGKQLIASGGFDFSEIRLSAGGGTAISLSGENTDAVTSGDSVAGSVRVLKNGSWGFATFNDLSSIERFFKSAVNSASIVVPRVKSGIAAGKSVTGKFSTKVSRDFSSVSVDEKFELLSGYNKILRNAEHIQTTRAVYRDGNSNYVYLNSEGSHLEYDRSYCGISLASVAKKGAVVQPYNESVSGFGGFEITENREALAEKVVKTAMDMLDAEPVEGGRYRVILDPKLSGVFIHEAFGHLSEADFVYENPSMRGIMVLGREFGPPELNVIDDGSIEHIAGYIPFDDEGIIPSKTFLIKNGTLSGRLHSRETADKMDEETTGNGRAMGVMKQPIVRMTNTYIENGAHSRDNIFAAMDDGLYAVSYIGGQTNLEMFTFTAAYGYRIKNGKPGKMFRDIILSGNVFTTLKNISMIGNDREMFGGLGGCGKGGQGPLPVTLGGPHMLVNDVLIGGGK